MVSALLTGGVSRAEAEYPVTFKAGRFLIPTLEQFHTRVAEKYPELEVRLKSLAAVTYRDQDYKGLLIESEGEIKGSRIEQTLTYIEKAPGIWKLLFVENKICLRGQALNSDKEWEEGWKCDESPFPISGFDDLFIAASVNIDLEAASAAFSQPVEVYVVDKAALEAEKAPPAVMTLADIEKVLKAVGSQMSVESAQYIAPLKGPEEAQPGLAILVKGRLSKRERVDQKFTYIFDGDFLLLKEIDGVYCRYIDRVEKEVCDPLYGPTPASPMPLKLRNSGELTKAPNSQPQQVAAQPSIPSGNQCGPLLGHLETILKFHFERSLFDGQALPEYRRFMKNIVLMADPMALILSNEEQSNMLAVIEGAADYEEQLARLVAEFKKGTAGDCSYLAGITKELQQSLLARVGEAYQLFGLAKQYGFNLQKVQAMTTLSDLQTNMLSQLPRFSKSQPTSLTPEQRMDLALGQMKTYIDSSLERLSSYEEYMVAVMAKQDAYSVLLNQPQQIVEGLEGHTIKKYFGMSVATGFSGRHYIVKAHPKVTDDFGLRVGDEILQVNQQKAHLLSYEALDGLLLNTAAPIDLVVSQAGTSRAVRLVAQELDPLDIFYDLELVESDGQRLLKIDLQSFQAGVAQKIHGDILKFLEQKGGIDGFVLDLKGNPGGSTEEAVNVMSFFVQDQPVSYYRLGARGRATVKPLMAKPEFFIDDSKPLVVLVDGATVSSAEIVASGLQSLGRSVTVGQETFGKLVGQYYTPIVLSNEKTMGLLVTAGEYFNAQGESLNGIGVVPDLIQEGGGVKAAFEDGISPGKDLSVEQRLPMSEYPFRKAFLEGTPAAESVASLELLASL